MFAHWGDNAMSGSALTSEKRTRSTILYDKDGKRLLFHVVVLSLFRRRRPTLVLDVTPSNLTPL